MPIPIQDEPESTIGRKPVEPPEHPKSPDHERGRSGASVRREEGDESDLAGESRERERSEPPAARAPEE